jgi:hypothetical protein
MSPKKRPDFAAATQQIQIADAIGRLALHLMTPHALRH